VAEISIKGARRTEFGKGASRRSRRDGFIPAVIYGHGEKPQHVALPSRELGIALKTSNVLIDVVLDDHTELTLPKSVSRDPLTGLLEHIDLVIVRRGERVVVSVPVHTEGKYDQDGILEHTNNSIEVETVRSAEVEEAPVVAAAAEGDAAAAPAEGDAAATAAAPAGGDDKKDKKK
jgi:large subunit ribosomal protein L25